VNTDRTLARIEGVECHLGLIRFEVIYLAVIVWHQSASSVMDSDLVPASFEMAGDAVAG
jgi:hypothetical protein